MLRESAWLVGQQTQISPNTDQVARVNHQTPSLRHNYSLKTVSPHHYTHNSSSALGKMATSTQCGECLSKKTLLAHRRLYYDKFSGFEVDDIDFMEEDGTGESSSNQKQSESPPPLVEFGSADNEGVCLTLSLIHCG